MEYDQLKQEEMDDMIAQNMHGREVEHYQHELNLAVFEHMLPNLADGDFKEHIRKMHREAGEEMAKISAIHAGLSAKLPEGPKRKAAHVRAAAKRKEQEAAALNRPR